MLFKSTLPFISRIIANNVRSRKIRNFSSCGIEEIQYEVVEPIYPISYPKRTFPPEIQGPDYAVTGVPKKHVNRSYVKSMDDISKIWNACKIAKTILMTSGKQLKAGMTCEDIDDIVYDLCLKHKCYPSPLSYSNFPKCVTTSVNNIAVHAIPDQRPLVKGDIISIDVSIFFDGVHGDCCHTFAVEECDQPAQHLLNVAELCLYEAINVCKAGTKLSLIGKTIEKIAKDYDMAVVRQFCGHGVGKDLHEDPQILHFSHESNKLMHENMIFTIEPIITESSNANIITHDDRWTVATEDGSRTAQYEHTIWIQKDKAEILTQI